MQRDEEDEAWQAIVDNYGERPAVEPVEESTPEVDAADPAEEGFAPEVGDTESDPLDEEFVPPTPPPIPRPPTDRLVAWGGVVGAPVLLFVSVLAGLDLPGWAVLTLVGGFVAGFGYLVLSLPKEPRDPWDNGAQV